MNYFVDIFILIFYDIPDSPNHTVFCFLFLFLFLLMQSTILFFIKFGKFIHFYFFILSCQSFCLILIFPAF